MILEFGGDPEALVPYPCCVSLTPAISVSTVVVTVIALVLPSSRSRRSLDGGGMRRVDEGDGGVAEARFRLWDPDQDTLGP